MNWASENGMGAQLKRRYDSAPFDRLTRSQVARSQVARSQVARLQVARLQVARLQVARLQVARLQVVYKFAGGLLDFIGLQAIYLLRTNLSLAFQYCFIRH